MNEAPRRHVPRGAFVSQGCEYSLKTQRNGVVVERTCPIGLCPHPGLGRDRFIYRLVNGDISVKKEQLTLRPSRCDSAFP